MNKFTDKEVVGLSGVGLGLDELVRHGAGQVIQQAIEAELSALLERFENVKTMHEQRAVVHNGYLPEREVLTAAGPIAVKVPKVRDRSGSGVKFNSSIVPPYVRKSPRVSAARIAAARRRPTPTEGFPGDPSARSAPARFDSAGTAHRYPWQSCACVARHSQDIGTRPGSARRPACQRQW